MDIAIPGIARQGPILRAAAVPIEAAGSGRIERNLVIVWRPGWQDLSDWVRVADHVVDIDPTIEPFIVRNEIPNSYSRRRAALRPTFVYSPGLIVRFSPMRGRVYHGSPIPKLEQLRRLTAAGVPVPKTAVITPDLKLDPTEWGDFVIVKPTDIATSSHGVAIQLMRTGRVRYIRPQDYPSDHPGRRGPMVVQHFVHTGERIALNRVLTLFGEPLYASMMYGPRSIVDPYKATDEELESAVIATQAITERQSEFVAEPEVLAMARRAHAAMPEIPQKGCDIIRDAKTGEMYVLEVNPGGNTWHFSSYVTRQNRTTRPPGHEARRQRQFDGFRTAARILVERTNAEAM